MIKIDEELVNKVTARAQESTRRRMNLNFHQEQADTLQRMINAMEPGTYIRPHKHEAPDKREAFVLIRGRVLYIEFDEIGNITDHFEMNRQQGAFGLEISPRAFHSLIALEPGSVVYELKDGPYDAAKDKIFAPWAPDEGAPEAGAYINSLMAKLGYTSV